tara:strand:- start:828 stop:1340 length:513 start_codon:yes stop_codon:yes gene_type:complete
MKIILMTFGMFLLVGMINAQDTSSVETYKIAFFSKDASGGFKKMKGKVVTNGDSIPTSFDLSIETASINTGNGMQNKHATSSEWFHSEKYPNIVFKGREVVSTDQGFMVSGKLTIAGVTKAVKLPLKISTDETQYLYQTKLTVDRADYEFGPKNKVSPSIKIIAKLSIKK